MSFTVCVLRINGRVILGESDTECYCVCREYVRGQYREELILNIMVFV